MPASIRQRFEYFAQRLSRRNLLLIGSVPVVVLLVFIVSLTRREPGKRVMAKKGPIVEAIYALGTVKAESTFTLKVGVASGIVRIHAIEGDIVQRGAPLLSTDSAGFQSPIAGTVTKVYSQQGETVMPGVPVMTVMDLSRTYVMLSLDQQSALRVKVGQPAELSFESIRGQKIKGRVTRMYPSEGQFIVRVVADKMPSEILPDMTADVAIEIVRRDNVLLIPVAAVSRGFVTLYRKGHRDRVQAKVGAVNSEWAEVLEGHIEEGDELLVPEKAQ